MHLISYPSAVVIVSGNLAFLNFSAVNSKLENARMSPLRGSKFYLRECYKHDAPRALKYQGLKPQS
ncbi:MAG: hypothetical protein JWO20_797 [Candidatus Angelobacter sp.]|jgi:hypothetical protein|nr:hypothetical protein [Candidatus Angelobacter sp.]